MLIPLLIAPLYFYEHSMIAVRISMIITVITVVTFIITTMIGVLPIILHYDLL
jgi:hypothetical protein